MMHSPIGSKILSAYAFVFAGLLPAMASVTALANGLGIMFAINIILAASIMIYGFHVFRGESRHIQTFAILVMLHYFGVTMTNLWNHDSFPSDSRAYHMAIPRMIRGVLFGCFYGWYYLIRKKTREGFES